MSAMRALRAATAVLCVLLGSATAEAGHEVTLGSSTRALRSTSADAVTGDALNGATVTYAHDLQVLPGLALWVGGDLASGAASGTMFQTLDTQVRSLALTGSVRARYPLMARVVASARVELGLAHTSLALRDAMGTAASDDGWAPLASGTLGLDLLAVELPRFQLGLRLELGYVSAVAVGLTASRAPAADATLRLRAIEAALGHLDLSGPSAGASIVSRF